MSRLFPTTGQVDLITGMTVTATWRSVKSSRLSQFLLNTLPSPFRCVLPSMQTVSDDPSLSHQQASFVPIATPKSASLSATDMDVVSLDDFNSAMSLSDDSEDTALVKNDKGKGKDTSRPSLSLETSILYWRDEQAKQTAIPLKVRSLCCNIIGS
jgi:hypothetical protein